MFLFVNPQGNFSSSAALLRRVWVVCLVIFAAATALLAQETRGTIRGRVVDSSGAVIPGAPVRATNVATNVTVSSQSNADGNYEIPYLLPGKYRLTSEMTGFKSFLRESIEIRIGDRIMIEIPMQVGDVRDQVTVTTDTPLLETATEIGRASCRERV